MVTRMMAGEAIIISIITIIIIKEMIKEKN